MLTTRPTSRLGVDGRKVPVFLTSVFAAAYGRTAFYLGAAWILVEDGEGATVVAGFFALVSVAELIASPIAGWAADRCSRKWLSVLADLSRAMVASAVACLPFADRQVVVFIAAIAFVFAERLSLTASQALVPDICRAMTLPDANSLLFFSMQCGNLIAAVGGGYVLSAYGFSIFFAIIAMAFLLSAVMMCLVRTKRCQVPPLRQIHVARFRAGTYAINLIDLITVYALLCGVATVVSAMTASLVFEELEGGALVFGLLEGAWSVGSIFGTLLMIPLSRWIKPWRLSTLVLAAVAIIMMATNFTTLPILVIVFGLLGLLYNVGRVGVEMHLQFTVANSRLGRVKGWMHAAGMALSLVVLGVLAIVGAAMRPSSAFSTFGFVVLGAAVLLIFRAGRAK